MLWVSWFQRRRFFLSFSHCKSTGANNPWGINSLDPRGLIGRVYVGDHWTLLLTKYISCGPNGFIRRFFMFFPIISLWELYMGMAAILIYGPWPFLQIFNPPLPGGHGFHPHRGQQHSFMEIDHEIFSTVILSHSLIQEGQLSVSGKTMCTILVNRLED